MAFSPYIGNNTIQKLGNYLVAYRKGDTGAVTGLVSNTNGDTWSALTDLFDGTEEDDLLTVGYDNTKILFGRMTKFSDSYGTLQSLAGDGVTSTENSAFTLRAQEVSDIFEFNGKSRLFSGDTLLEFNNIDYKLNTVDSQYTAIDRNSFEDVRIVTLEDRLLRIDRHYGVYHMLYSDLTTWIKDANGDDIDYLAEGDFLLYAVYLNGEIHFHSYDSSNSTHKVTKTSDGIVSTSQTPTLSEQPAPLMYDPVLDGGVYIHANTNTFDGTWSSTKEFSTSTDGIMRVSKGILNGLDAGGKLGKFKKIANDYFFTSGQSDAFKLYRTADLVNATISFSDVLGVTDFAYNGTMYLLALTDGTLQISSDGISWSVLSNPPDATNLNIIGLFTIGTSFIILGGPRSYGPGGTFQADKIIVSSDDGSTWVTKSIPTADDSTLSVSSVEYITGTNRIIVKQSFSNTISTDSAGEFFLASNDLGDTWNYTPSELGRGVRIAPEPSFIRSFFNGSVLFQSSYSYIDISNVNTLNLSYDGGVTWANVPHNITLPSSVISSFGFYSEIYYNGTSHILMICDAELVSVNLYSSTDATFTSWVPIVENLAMFSPYLVKVNINTKPKLFLMGNTAILAVDFFDSISGSYSTLLFASSADFLVWEAKFLVSEDNGTSWNLTDTGAILPSYTNVVGYDITTESSGSYSLVDVAYLEGLNRAVAIVSLVLQEYITIP